LEAHGPRNSPINRSDPAFCALLDARGVVLPPPRTARRHASAPLTEEVALRLLRDGARPPLRRELNERAFREIWLGLDRARGAPAPIPRLPAG
jgi:hypothetical protein